MRPPLTWTERDDVLRPEDADLDPDRSEGLQVTFAEAVMAAIDAHLGSDPSRELGGLLVGRPLRDRRSGRLAVVVEAALPATGGHGSPKRFEFTPEAWEAVEAARGGRHVAGWYHSHPNLGAYLSATDRATQAAFFPEPWQLALVVDPVRGERALFAGALAEKVVVAGETPLASLRLDVGRGG